jgi:hypothetical protein
VARGLTFGVVAVGAVMVVSAGCGRSVLVDQQRLEDEIASDLVPGAVDAVTDVECPELILPGTTVSCTAAIGGVPIDVVVQLSEEAEAALSTDAIVVEVPEMEKAAAVRLTADLGVETTVTCPGPAVVVSVPGATLECDAVDPAGGHHDVVFTIRSERGDWDLSIE